MSTPKVQHVYSEMPSGANHSRMTKMIYPNGRTLHYGYDSGLDSSISRLSFLADDNGSGGIGTHLEDLSYLGLGTIVKRAHPQPGVDLTYIKQGVEPNGEAGDQYAGLDRFGRIADQRWIKTSDGSHTDRYQYGHDRNGNRLYEKNLVDAAFSELYQVDGASAGYDPLNQLTEFQRGVLSDTNSDGIPDTISSETRRQVWDFDALGNFDNQTTDGTGQTRTHNRQNQIPSIQGLTTPAYDANGNMTTDQTGKTLVYDPWNRFVAYKDGSTMLVSYKHDALNRRVVENPGTERVLYYSAEWQVLEEREGGIAKPQYVWSPVYIDAMVLRDRDADGNSGNGLEERLYVQQDSTFNVTAVATAAGGLTERYGYDPFGLVTVYDAEYAVREAGSEYSWTYTYQGREAGLVTVMHHFRRRDFAPTLGRWIQVDPIGFRGGDPNLYRTFANEPIAHFDPYGLTARPSECRCGLDITDNLTRGLAGVAKAFSELSATDRRYLCKGIFSFPTGLYGWDIKALIGDNPKTILSRGDCGKGRCAGTVTVKGQCFCATAVNYALFGKIARLCHDDGQSTPGLTWARNTAKFHRMLKHNYERVASGGCNPDPADIDVWVIAGWTGSYAATERRFVSGCPACNQKFLGPSDYVVMHALFLYFATGEETGWIHVTIDDPIH
jgi:RHS repeat-associated protein